MRRYCSRAKKSGGRKESSRTLNSDNPMAIAKGSATNSSSPATAGRAISGPAHPSRRAFGRVRVAPGGAGAVMEGP